MALLRLPLSAFGDGLGTARREHYRELPAMAGGNVQNRYVGDWLLWGGRAGSAGEGEATAWALRYAGHGPARPLRPGHGVERIEAMGADALDGIVALPVLEPASPRKWYEWPGREHGPASVLFLRQHDLGFTPLGRLDARPVAGALKDGCVASCVDWYGNARPIFIDERVFALLGYELVEGRLAGDRSATPTLVERRRLSFAPADLGTGRYTPSP